jgi:hypothetical protein
LLEEQKMNKLTAEILKVNQFAQGFYMQKNNEKVINFLISLDLLVKGVLTHWQIKLQEGDRTKGQKIMKGLDVKFPLLLGD